MKKLYLFLLCTTAFSTISLSQNWTEVNTNLPVLTARGLAKIGDTLFVGLQDGGIFYSINSGDSWISHPVSSQAQNTGMNKFYGINASTPGGDGYFYNLGTSNMQYYEVGLGLVDINFLITQMGNQEVLSFAASENPSIRYIGTEDGLYYYNTNDNIVLESSGLSGNARVVNSVFDDEERILAGTNSGLYVSADSGSTFALDTSFIPSAERINEIGAFTLTNNGVYFLQTGPTFIPLILGGDYLCSYWDMMGSGDAYFFGDNVGSKINSSFEPSPVSLDGITGGKILSTVVMNNYVFVCTENGGVFRYGDSTTVGIQNQASANHISILPNPTNDIITINSNQAGDYIIEITDISGKSLKVIKSTINQTGTEINVSELSDGIFFVFLKNENGLVKRSKIVVRK